MRMGVGRCGGRVYRYNGVTSPLPLPGDPWQKGLTVTDVFDATTVAEIVGGAAGRVQLGVLAGELFVRARLEGVSLVGPDGLLAGLA
jgi:hypothetical protein